MTLDEFRERLITDENRRHAEIMVANWNRGEDVMSVINELHSDMLSAIDDDDYILPYYFGYLNRI